MVVGKNMHFGGVQGVRHNKVRDDCIFKERCSISSHSYYWETL
jgi:hypothetical protein